MYNEQEIPFHTSRANTSHFQNVKSHFKINVLFFFFDELRANENITELAAANAIIGWCWQTTFSKLSGLERSYSTLILEGTLTKHCVLLAIFLELIVTYLACRIHTLAAVVIFMNVQGRRVKRSWTDQCTVHSGKSRKCHTFCECFQWNYFVHCGVTFGPPFKKVVCKKNTCNALKLRCSTGQRQIWLSRF